MKRIRNKVWLQKSAEGLWTRNTEKRILYVVMIFFFFFFYHFTAFFFFYFTILYWFCHTSTWIRHGRTRVPHPEPPSHLPPCTIPPGHPSTPAPSILYRTWTGDSFLIWYYTCFHAIPPNHPTLSLSHRVQKTVLYICVSSAVSNTGLSLSSFSYRYHLSKFHIYALVYCIGVFLSGLLHSV